MQAPWAPPFGLCRPGVLSGSNKISLAVSTLVGPRLPCRGVLDSREHAAHVRAAVKTTRQQEQYALANGMKTKKFIIKLVMII